MKKVSLGIFKGQKSKNFDFEMFLKSLKGPRATLVKSRHSAHPNVSAQWEKAASMVLLRMCMRK